MTISGDIAACTLCKKMTDRVTKPRGKIGSKIVFLVPAPSQKAAKKNKLMSDWPGKLFVKGLCTYSGFRIWKKALAIPITFCHSKMNLVASRNCRNYVNSFLDPPPKICVVVGNDVYKAYFEDGKMPDMLCGTSLKEEDYEWEFFFMSDYRNIEFEDERTEYWSRRVLSELRAFRDFLRVRKFS